MNRRIVFPLLFVCFAAVIPAGGGKEKPTLVEATGIVRLVGNAPFYELVITGPDREWHIAKEEQAKLKDLQHQIITVKGEETVVTLTFASGLPAGERYTLKNIEILTIENEPG